MTRTAFFNVPAHGHVNPSLPVVAELVRRGDEVTVFLTEAFRTAVEATGARFEVYADYPEGLLEGIDGNPTRLAVRMLDACRRMTPGLVALLRDGGYQAVMFDSMAPWGYIAARMTGLPLVSSKGLLALDMKILLSSGLLGQLAPFVLKNLGNLRTYQSQAKQLSKQFGVPLPSFSEVLDMPGDLTVVYTSRQFQPMDHLFPDFCYIGPSLPDQPDDAGFPFDQLTGAPLLYISLGTVNNDAVAFYRACFEAFGGGPWQVVLSAGSRVSLADLGEIPANFIVRPHVPQLAVLRRATLFVTHGGMNSVHEGLQFRVPLVVVPQTLEQSIVARQVVRLGAGVLLSKPTAARLRRAVEQVQANPAYRANAEAVARGFAKAGGVVAAADAIQAFLRERV
jgi:MGT family glycosyltransferase